MHDIEGARVLVMGGTSGVGRATAALLSEQGCEVILTGRSYERLRETADAVPGVSAHRVDALQRGQVDALLHQLGAIDHLVVCVSGGEGAGRFATLDLQGLRRAFTAKTLAQLEVVQAALPHLDPAGSVTLITAASARAALPGTAGLAAVNGALEAAVRPLAAELAPLRVNAVSPGVVDTPWWNGLAEAERGAYFSAVASHLPAGRIGRPYDIATAVAFLISNTFVTGHILAVDGGANLAR
jgi:NAD(P)-dependent dehydrogenase (short-subunit alcohol dehydrogenase family)